MSESLELTIAHEQDEDGWVVAQILEVPGAESSSDISAATAAPPSAAPSTPSGAARAAFRWFSPR